MHGDENGPHRTHTIKINFESLKMSPARSLALEKLLLSLFTNKIQLNDPKTVYIDGLSAVLTRRI